MGKYFNYVMEHFTAIREIDVSDAQLVSFHATTVHKTLTKLAFLCCSITSNALLQLSSHVCHIEKLNFNLVTLLNDSTGDDGFTVDMPQTSIGEIFVWQGNKKDFLAKVCKSRPSGTAQGIIQYFVIDEDGNFEIEGGFYNEMVSIEVCHLTCNVVYQLQNSQRSLRSI